MANWQYYLVNMAALFRTFMATFTSEFGDFSQKILADQISVMTLNYSEGIS